MKQYTITTDFIRDVQSGKTNYYMATKHKEPVELHACSKSYLNSVHGDDCQYKVMGDVVGI